MKEKPSGRVGKRRPAINVPKRSKQRVAGVGREPSARDRKSTRLNSSHGYISYAVFCLKKKNAGLLSAAVFLALVAAYHLAAASPLQLAATSALADSAAAASCTVGTAYTPPRALGRPRR